jgi:hypothetical protein
MCLEAPLSMSQVSSPGVTDPERVDVTHYFGHSGDVSTVMCSGSHKDLLPEKSDCCLLLQNIFLR